MAFAKVLQELLKWIPVIKILIEDHGDAKKALAALKKQRVARRAARDRRMGI